VREGAIYQSTSDTEVILHLVARSRKARIVERFVEALRAASRAPMRWWR
jgi:amidophosphoribosyltransferase